METEFTLTKEETENIAQVFGLRLIDWRRMTDTEACGEMRRFVDKIGWQLFQSAVRRARAQEGRPRLAKLVAIHTLGLPELRGVNLVKNPPDWDDGKLWRFLFSTMALDEMKREEQRLHRILFEQAMAEQAAS